MLHLRYPRYAPGKGGVTNSGNLVKLLQHRIVGGDENLESHNVQ